MPPRTPRNAKTKIVFSRLMPTHPYVLLLQRRNTALQLEAGSSRKRLLDAVRSRGLPSPAAGGRMLTSAKKTIALQRMTGTSVHASGLELELFAAEYQSSCFLQELSLQLMTENPNQAWAGPLSCLGHPKQAKTGEDL